MDQLINQYCSSLTRYNRFSTREVKIGDVPLGGSNPIRIQSMTTTDTMNTIATVEQTIRMVDAGCEYVRITAPSIHEAQNLAEIKKELRKRGCRVPLIADIHFTPNAAELAARIVEKVRVNPGNYADKKRFKKIDFTEDEYQAELERIRERFTPLVKICKEYGTAMRIGTNHGSLSDRIMSRYGDTPLGMVESALEFLRICEDLNYYDVVLSMKASNTRVMVQAYRLLVKKMSEAGMNYPLHLGVTEAGDGEDGRTKSAVGIGTLLEDGLGDTIRVSLTEDPEHESPVAIKLAERYKNRSSHSDIPPVMNIPFDPFTYNKRKSFSLKGLGDDNVPRVFVDLSRMEIKAPEDLETAGYSYNAETDKWTLADSAADFIYAGRNELPFELPMNLNAVYDYSFWLKMENKTGYPLLSFDEYVSAKEKSSELNFVVTSVYDIKRLEVLKEDVTAAVVLVTDNLHGMAEQRRIFFELSDKGINNPVVIKRSYGRLNQERFMLYSSTDFGALLIDGFGDGLWAEVSLEEVPQQQEGLKAVNRILFGILQASRLRISRTEYIACPSCGRTLFDLQSVTAQIRKRTGHLKGVKIGIMGCIVNGPGEMADADYGYVGSGPGKITLYRGQNIVKRSIDSESAVDELIELIKEDNRWEEPRRL